MYCSRVGCWQVAPCPAHQRKIERRLVQGHTDAVTCLELGKQTWNAGMMLSGSEDCTARLWDLVGGKALRCLKAFGTNAVNSVCFSPTENLICAAAGNEISFFDLRQQSVILRKATHVCLNSDEINEICFNERGCT